MNSPKEFFIVWNPAGSKPPVFKHKTFASAKEEAKRLALQNSGQKFYVMGSCYSAHIGFTEEHFNEIPF